MTKRLAVVGMGKMGRAVAELAPSHGWELVARLDHAEMTSGFTTQMLNGADVAVEFSVPEAAPANIRAIVAAGCPVVVGTTGWYEHLDEIRRDVTASNGALLAATNFSLGVNIFERIIARAAELFAAAPGFDAHMIETHHAAKKDAPSGTALTLAKAAAAAGGDARFRSRACASATCLEFTKSSSTRSSSRFDCSTSLAIAGCLPKARSSRPGGLSAGAVFSP